MFLYFYLVPLAIFVVPLVVLAILFSKIFSRLKRIEQELGIADKAHQHNTAVSQQAQSPTAKEAQKTEVSPESADTTSHVPEAAPVTPQQSTSQQSAFVAWITEDWLMKVGAILILIAVGWFVTYAFMEGWIGPLGRIALGFVFGAAVMVGGKLRIAKYKNQGSVMLVLGSTVVLLTTFAARYMYGFFTPFTALTVMLLSTAFVALSSVVHKSRALAISSLILASLAPLLTAGTPGVEGVLSYVAVVVVGTLWVVALTNWRILTLGAFITTVLYSLQYLMPGTGPAVQQIALLFAWGFATLFFVVNVVSFVKEKSEDLSTADITVAVANGAFLLTWILTAVSNEWQSLVLVVWALAFALGSYVVFKFTDKSAPFLTYSSIAGGLVAAATAVELSGAALTIAYTVEILLLLLFLGVVTQKQKLLRTVSFLYVVPAFMSLEHMASAAWGSGVIHADFFALLTLLGAFFISGVYVYYYVGGQQVDNEASRSLTKIYVLAVALYSTALLWLTLHAAPAVATDTATAIALLVYTVAGLVLYFVGKRDGSKFVRYLGLTFVWGVVGRLLLVEFWMMDIVGKVITFFVIGGLFSATAFLGKNKGEPETNPKETQITNDEQ